MFSIGNGQITADILDPVADRGRLGPRFCWGGYLWQVHSRTAGPLFTGPEWPSPTPAAFNGQGLPESFRHQTREGQPLTWKGNRGVALGIGELARDADGGISVVVPCDWSVTRADAQIHFHTEQRVAGFHYDLVRTVQLTGRTLLSTSQLTNLAEDPLRLQWFAHPFFALTDRLIEVQLPEQASLNENPGFSLHGRELRLKRRFDHEKDGHMDFLHLPPGRPLEATLSHPALAKLEFATDFSPDETVIWANNATFSIEPYRRLHLVHGETRTWSLTYRFGAEAAAGNSP